MPRYEYRCSKGHQYERSEGFDAPSEQTCPKCGGRSRRLISMPAVIFKGSGFYSTDNRKSSAISGDSGDGGSSSGDGASSDGGSGSASSDSGDTAASGGKSKAEEAKKTD